MRILLLALATLGLTGCSSIIEGTSQTLAVNTNPAGATCGLYRQNNSIGTIAATPGSVLVQKTKHDITVVCVKDGYQQATYLNRSGAAGATVGNIILGGGIGWAIDSATGADNKYDTPINVSLVPNLPGGVVTPTALPTSLVPAVPTTAAPTVPTASTPAAGAVPQS